MIKIINNDLCTCQWQKKILSVLTQSDEVIWMSISSVMLFHSL